MRVVSALAVIAALACLMPISRSYAEQPSVPRAEIVHIPVSPLPFILQGFLRRSEGTGRSPAVVLLPHCGRYAKAVDESWGARISSWGYVTLTIDSFSARGIKDCNASMNADDLAFDAYRGLEFLVQDVLLIQNARPSWALRRARCKHFRP
jgi:dienelactone hydrolase